MIKSVQEKREAEDGEELLSEDLDKKQQHSD